MTENDLRTIARKLPPGLAQAANLLGWAQGPLCAMEDSPITRERGAALSLDDLSAKRDAMGLGLLEATVRGLVAEHNAIPVLIEVARAALRLRAAGRSASRARQGVPWTASSQSAEEEVSRTNAEWHAADEAYDAALAKVTCSVQASPPEDPPASVNAKTDATATGESPVDPASRWKLYLDDLSAKRAAIREDDLVGYRGLGPDKTNVWSWATVRGLVAEHNAMPVLIEIARAAKAPRHSSTKTDTTGILHLLKAWSLAAFNGGRMDTSNFQQWWARHQDSAERMFARVLASSTGESPLDPVAPPTDLKSRSTIAVLAMLRERRRQLREATSVGPDGEPTASDAEVVAYRRLVAELQAELERINHDQK